MIDILLLCAVVIMLCVVASRFSNRVGMPALLCFMALGMVFGSDGLFKIPFDSFRIAKDVCTIGLVFIMFYGGFDVNWKTAKPVALQSVLLSTIGVALTAFFTAGFCYWGLNFSFAESFLTGAVLSSTDAASVFSILKSKKLNLKDGAASLLELESGSNDPIAYLLVMIGIQMVNGGGGHSIGYLLFSGIVYGVLIGAAIAYLGVFILKKVDFVMDGLDTIFVIALVLLSYALPEFVGGNGFLSTYIMGIILGNSRIDNKIILAHFFDGITGLAQIVLFFLLGLLSYPHMLWDAALPAIAIALFMLLVVRPVSMFILMKPFKTTMAKWGLISWAGLRGAASIVFAIIVVADGHELGVDLFHIVFFVSLISVALQGGLLPFVAKKLDMIDAHGDVRKTFNDYQDESDISLIKISVKDGHNWENRLIRDVSMPTGALAIMIKRDNKILTPRGDTTILSGDKIILSVPSYQGNDEISLKEVHIGHSHKWCNKMVEELNLARHKLIVMIKRNDETIIPRGNTRIMEDDLVVVSKITE